MTTRLHRPARRTSEQGGITILVVLSLLVLMTSAAISMSRNSLRELMIVGSSRQAANVRQAADAGLEFALLWINDKNNPSGGSSLDFQRKADSLAVNSEERGSYFLISGGTPTTDTTLQTTPDYTQAYTMKLLRVGKIDTNLSSPLDPRTKNDLWVVHAAGLVKAGTTTFEHDKEMWVTTAVREKKF